MNLSMNNLSMYNLIYKNATMDKMRTYKEKIKKGILTLEELVLDQDTINNIKFNSNHFVDFLTINQLMNLIKIVITYPTEEDSNASKLPFNCTELLSCENLQIVEKFFEDQSKKIIPTKYQFEKDDDVEDINIDSFYANISETKSMAKLKEKISSLNKIEFDKNEKSNIDKNTDKEMDDNREIISASDLLGKILNDNDDNEDGEVTEIDRDEKNKDEPNVDSSLKNGDSSLSNEKVDVENLMSKVNSIVNEIQSELELDQNANKEESNSGELKQLENNNEKLEIDDSQVQEANKLINDSVQSPSVLIINTDAENSENIENTENKDKTNNVNNSNVNNDKINNNVNVNSEIENNVDNNQNENEFTKANEPSSEDAYIDQSKISANPSIKTEIDIYLEESKYPLLDYLFSFLKTDEQLDHVLCGYFNKIFNSLFAVKPLHLVKYLFERPETIISMVHHFNRISIIDCLIKLIKFDTDQIILFEKKSCDEVKEEVFKEIFEIIENRLFINEDSNDLEMLHSVTEFFLECLEDKRTFVFFIKCPKFSLKFFETFLNPILSQQLNVVVRYIEKVYVELTYKPNKQPEVKPKGITFKGDISGNFSADKDEDNSSECYYFLELFSSMIEYLFTRFKDESFGLYSDSEFDNTFGESQKKLGLSKLHIMNLIHQILKHSFYVHENRYFSYEEDFFIDFYGKFIENDFFPTAVKYFFEFPWNNLYQNMFLDIVNEIISFSNFNRTLAEHLLYEISFLDELILCVIDEKYSCISKFQFKENKSISKKFQYKVNEIQNGFFIFIIEIAHNIKIQSYNNPVLASIIQKSKLI